MTGANHESSAVYHVRPVHHPLAAVVHVPGSKSIANRALICATLAEGSTVLRNVPSGDDTAAMLDLSLIHISEPTRPY